MLLCNINVQHNCAKQKCDLSATRKAYLEREELPNAAPKVHHKNEDDLILNTARMRDAKIIQRFVAKLPDLDLDSIVRESCRLDIASRQ